MRDPDGISVETQELELREEVKADYTRMAENDPMGDSFRAAQLNSHNLNNVRSLMEKYPDEYASRMKQSAIRPKYKRHRGHDKNWFTDTFAWHIAKGLFDADKVEGVQKGLGNDNLGLPEDFLQNPDVKNGLIQLADRPWGDTKVGEYLLKRFKLRESGPPSPIRRYKIDSSPFS